MTPTQYQKLLGQIVINPGYMTWAFTHINDLAKELNRIPWLCTIPEHRTTVMLWALEMTLMNKVIPPKDFIRELILFSLPLQ